jgi:GNAT superfamily N-acetyltransferase
MHEPPRSLALELACSAVLERPPSRLRPGALFQEVIGQRYIPFGSPCPLYMAETLLGCRIRAQNNLLDVLIPVLESEPLDGAILSRRNRTRLLRIAEKVVPITEVWRNELFYTDRAHFVPKRGHHVERLSIDHLPQAGAPERAHAGRGEFEGAFGVVHKGEVVSYADYAALSLLVSSIAVFTDPRYRGLGLGASVVSAATEEILRTGKVPVYFTDFRNAASLALCQSLGYMRFGQDLWAFTEP